MITPIEEMVIEECDDSITGATKFSEVRVLWPFCKTLEVHYSNIRIHELSKQGTFEISEYKHLDSL